jgi:hypothetical protein
MGSESAIQLEDVNVKIFEAQGSAIGAAPHNSAQRFAIDAGVPADDIKDATLDWRQQWKRLSTSWAKRHHRHHLSFRAKCRHDGVFGGRTAPCLPVSA